MLFLLITILLFELYLLHRVLDYFLLSPVYIYVIYGVLCIVLTVLYYYFFENKFSLFGVDIVSSLSFLAAIRMYITALISFILGVIIYYDQSSKKTKKLFNRSFSDKLFLNYKVSKIILYFAIAIFVMIVFLFLITYGKGIFIREDYIPNRNKGLTIIIKILSFIETLILGCLYKKNKVISISLFLLFLLITLGTGSRTVFLFFILYTFLVFISNRNTLLNKVRFSIQILFSLVLLAYIMQLRQLPEHGVIPYLKSIGSSSQGFYRSFFFNIYYSFIYGVFVTIRTVEESQLDWNIIFININPLPGFLAGWYDHANNMRINMYAPYSLHGRVFRTGITFTIVYFFLAGLIFSYFEKAIRNLLTENKRIYSFVLTIILILHIVYAFEYNMRSAIRYFYYAFFIVFVVYIFKQVKKNLPKKNEQKS
jgi:hypothetical protein